MEGENLLLDEAQLTEAQFLQSNFKDCYIQLMSQIKRLGSMIGRKRDWLELTWVIYKKK